MEIFIKTTNIKLTPDLEKFIKEKIESCQKFFPDKKFPLKVECELEKTPNRRQKGFIFRVEINLELPQRKRVLRVETIKEEIHAAINEVKDRLQIEIKKYKNKKFKVD